MPHLNIKIVDYHIDVDAKASSRRKNELLELIRNSEDIDDLKAVQKNYYWDRVNRLMNMDDYEEVSQAWEDKRDALKALNLTSSWKNAEALADFISKKYDCDAMAEKPYGDHADLYAYIPMSVTEESFRSVLDIWCEKHNCEYELLNQSPEAPSPQYFPKNPKLMYPRRANYEKLEKQEKDFKIAQRLFFEKNKRKFDPNNQDDRDAIVEIYNNYMEELSQWRPVLIRIKDKPKTAQNGRALDKIHDSEDSDEIAELISLLGEAHSKIIEANELASDLEREDRISSALLYAVEDLEAEASELDFEGSDDPVSALLDKYGLDSDELDEEDESEDLDIDFEDSIEDDKPGEKQLKERFEGRSAIFTGLDEYDDEEDVVGFPEGSKLREHENEPCSIYALAIYNGDNFEDCYWMIEFDGDVSFTPVPGVALKLIE